MKAHTRIWMHLVIFNVLKNRSSLTFMTAINLATWRINLISRWVSIRNLLIKPRESRIHSSIREKTWLWIPLVPTMLWSCKVSPLILMKCNSTNFKVPIMKAPKMILKIQTLLIRWKRLWLYHLWNWIQKLQTKITSPWILFTKRIKMMSLFVW